MPPLVDCLHEDNSFFLGNISMSMIQSLLTLFCLRLRSIVIHPLGDLLALCYSCFSTLKVWLLNSNESCIRAFLFPAIILERKKRGGKERYWRQHHRRCRSPVVLSTDNRVSWGVPVACGIRKKRTRREVVDNNIYDILSLMPFLSPVVLYWGYLRNSCFGMIEEWHPK